VRLHVVALTVVLDDQDRVLMMWRHRFPTDEWGWELPGRDRRRRRGFCDHRCSRGRGETGWWPDAVEHVVSFQPMPGMVNTAHELFLVHGAHEVGEPTDLEEAARIEWVPFDEVVDLVRRDPRLRFARRTALRFRPAGRAVLDGKEQRLTPTRGGDGA
jgi:hypothetical protein